MSNKKSAARKQVAAKKPVEERLTPAELEDTHTHVFSQPPFAAELFARSLVDTIIEEGAKKLYDNYLTSKIADHTADSIVAMMNQLVSVEFRKSDNRFNDHSEMKEEHVAKNDYDAHSTYAINIDKKLVSVLPDDLLHQQESLAQDPIASKASKTFHTTKSRLRGSSSGGERSQELTKTQKKKLLDDMLVPLEQEPLTESQKREKQEEAIMRTTYINQLKEERKQKEIDILNAIQERKKEMLRLKRIKEMEQKQFTYDYDGKPLFLAKKKKSADGNSAAPASSNPNTSSHVCAVPYEIKSQRQNENNNEISDSRGTLKPILHSGSVQLRESLNVAPQGDQNTAIEGISRTVGFRSTSTDPRSTMEVAVRRKMQNIPIEIAVEVPINQRYLKKPKGSSTTASSTVNTNNTSANGTGVLAKIRDAKNDITDEEYNNGHQRQTSMIPYMTLREGVKFTEANNGNEVTKIPSTAGMEVRRRTNQMSKADYFKLIEDPRMIDPSIQQQLNNISLFDSKSEFLNRDSEVDEFKRQRLKNLFMGENSNNVSRSQALNERDNSVLDDMDGAGSATGYAIGFDPVVIRDSTAQGFHLRGSTAGSNNAKQYHNNLNPNYFKNYIPSAHLERNVKTAFPSTNATTKHRSITQQSNGFNSHNNNNINTSTTVNPNEQTKDPSMILPVLSAYQRKKQSGLTDHTRGQSAGGEKLRQRSKSHHPNHQNLSSAGAADGSILIDAATMHDTTSNAFNLKKTVLQEIQMKSTNNRSTLPHQQRAQSNKSQGTRKLSPKQQSRKGTPAGTSHQQHELKDKDGNFVTFGNNESIVKLLVTH